MIRIITDQRHDYYKNSRCDLITVFACMMIMTFHYDSHYANYDNDTGL